MNNRQRVKAILNYEEYDRMPVVHFGYWQETAQKWANEGHISKDLLNKGSIYSYEVETPISEKLGFDFGWNPLVGGNTSLNPPFERKVLEIDDKGFKRVRNVNGVIELEKEGAGSIPAEIDHLLKDRKSWEKHFKHRLKYDKSRINKEGIKELKENIDDYDLPIGVHCGSLFGRIRDIMGLEGVSYLYADDEELYKEIIDTVANLCYQTTKELLKSDIDFDYAHFWEDISFKNGPLVSPKIFREYVGPHYKRITDLVKENGIDIISLDSDGKIDALIPVWLDNGVNTMFPIEVGTWNASIEPWRKKYGKKIRGVGGMDKKVFAYDYKAIDKEIERIKRLIALGGYIPCPDHRIPPDAKWENVQYYCEQMRKI